MGCEGSLTFEAYVGWGPSVPSGRRVRLGTMVRSYSSLVVAEMQSETASAIAARCLRGLTKRPLHLCLAAPRWKARSCQICYAIEG